MDADLGADNQAAVAESQVIIFSSPKPRKANTEAVQISAFRSWRRIFPKARILLFGDGATWESFAHEEGLQLAGPLPVGAEGGEVIRFLFEKTSKLAGDGLAMYLNSDILLDQSALTAVARLESLPGPWLASARRCCLAEWAGPALKEDEEWQRFYKRAREESVWGPACAMDMFLFRGISFEAMPPFLIGHRGWDNWMIFHARANRIPVIDLSHEMRAFHYDHDYSYAKGNSAPSRRDGPLEEANLKMLGGEERLFHLGHATHELSHGTVRRCPSWGSLQRSMELWQIEHPGQRWWWRPVRRFFHPLIKRWQMITTREENWNCKPERVPR